VSKRRKISSYSNNGGDFIEIVEVEQGIIHLRVGSCCVMEIDSFVPVEFLTGVIHNAMMEYGDIYKIIDSFGWEDVYRAELKSRVAKVKY